MLRRFGAASALCLVLANLAQFGRACSLCTPGVNTATLRADAANAKLIVYGTLSNPRLNPALAGSAPDGSATDLAVERVVKADPILAGRKSLTLPRYIPVDPKDPSKFLIFCDVVNGKLDPFRGCPATPALVEYLSGAMKMGPNDPATFYAYFGRFLDHADPEIAGDAFREIARAGDADVAAAAKHLEPSRLRKLLADPRTPPERLTLFAYLLGGCGTPADADFLARMLRQPEDRADRAFGGLLAGYIQLRPDDGWRLLLTVISDPRQSFPRRLAALSTVRFFYRSQPAARPRALQAVARLVPQGELTDLAVEDLRQWREWELTAEILAQFGKPSHAAPMVRRAIIRYALCCPKAEAKQFVEQLRHSDPQLVREVEESLEFEQTTPRSPGR
ncbi:MAG TPA: hypothetical protein VH120_15740 [Gemmataceae bacterium]|nr:hypothetical protein [Gemmataceae bacterium]